MGLAARPGRGRPGRRRLHAGRATSSRRVGLTCGGHGAQQRPRTRGFFWLGRHRTGAIPTHTCFRRLHLRRRSAPPSAASRSLRPRCCPSRPSPIATEEPPELVVSRLRRYGLSSLVSGGVVSGCALRARVFRACSRTLASRLPEVLIIDSLTEWAFHTGIESMNDPLAMRKIISLLRLLADAGVAVFIVHHGRKEDGELRDSVDHAASPDLLIGFHGVDPEGKVVPFRATNLRRLSAVGRWPVESVVVGFRDSQYYVRRSPRSGVGRLEDCTSKLSVMLGTRGGRAQRVDAPALSAVPVRSSLEVLVESPSSSSSFAVLPPGDRAARAERIATGAQGPVSSTGPRSRRRACAPCVRPPLGSRAWQASSGGRRRPSSSMPTRRRATTRLCASTRSPRRSRRFARRGRVRRTSAGPRATCRWAGRRCRACRCCRSPPDLPVPFRSSSSPLFATSAPRTGCQRSPSSSRPRISSSPIDCRSVFCPRAVAARSVDLRRPAVRVSSHARHAHCRRHRPAAPALRALERAAPRRLFGGSRPPYVHRVGDRGHAA